MERRHPARRGEKKAGLGKVERDLLRDVILQGTGAANSSVIVGPGVGLDNAVIDLGGERVLVVTTDPLTLIPSIGLEDSAWLTVHEIASDLTTSGLRPQFAVLDYNLPPSLSSDDFRRYAEAVSSECRKLGVAIVGGHTGRYPGCDFSIVGGGIMMAIGGADAYVTPRMAGEGDELIMTKGAAIEATAVLSLAFPEKTRSKLGERAAKRAMAYLRRCSTVVDASAATTVGVRSEGVTSMHDATEGGVLGGLYELARASGKTLLVDHERVHVSEETALLCSEFDLDPLVTLSEGTLLITCRPGRTGQVLAKLSERGVRGFVIGRVGGKEDDEGGRDEDDGGEEGGRRRRSGAVSKNEKKKERAGQGRLLLSKDGHTTSYTPPEFDPYWAVYAKGLKEGWR